MSALIAPNQLRKYYTWYTGGFIVFLLVLAVAEQMGLSRQYIGYAFLFAPLPCTQALGIAGHTADVAEYYVAGRRVPALFNGMATGADWMRRCIVHRHGRNVYLAGFDGLSFVMGWTGGYCLVASCLRRIYASSASSRSRIFSVRATAATSCARDRHNFVPIIIHSSVSSRRSTASA